MKEQWETFDEHEIREDEYQEKWANLMNAVDTGWSGSEKKFFDRIADRESIKDIYELRDRELEIREKLTELLKEDYGIGFEWDEEYWLKWFFGEDWFPQEREDGSICIEFNYGRKLQLHAKYEYRDLKHWEEEEYGERCY